jgi:riboflavin kinase/FMN adenylyltransferase
VKLFRDLDSIGPMPAPHVGIGNFDGVHLGHQRLLRTVLERARAAGGAAVAMTFDPHPLSILSPGGRPPLITPLPEKVRLIEEIGLDVLIIAPFTRELAAVSAESFVGQILAGRLRARAAFVGGNFHFGRGGVGDFDLLAREGARHGIQVEKVPIVLYDSRPVSSTRIRENILKGSVDRVAGMLGREYALVGRGVPGKHRGRELGFSTANLTTENELIPGDGIYVTRTEVDGARRPSSTYIGVRPTYGEEERVIETHILDYEGAPLYGRTVRLHFCRWLREDRRFDSPAALAAQIARDVDETRRWFGENCGSLPGRP